MASSSSCRSKKHHVFLSFQGADTRHSFVSHLYGYLHDRLAIPTFIDNRLERGEEIETAILKAIEDSHISVIIISKNFASSPWCLDEVVKIFECKEQFGQRVIPVFYLVDPTQVCDQTGSFAEDFAKHEQDFGDSVERVQKWRIALRKAANISGVVLTESKSEYADLQDIVKGIVNYLRELYPCKVQNLVGLQSQIKCVESLLSIEFDDVRIVGLWGMAGIGKTTLARVVFENLSSHFDCKCFIDNVREKCSQTGGKDKLEEELLSKILGEKNIYPNHGMLMNMLCYKKILLVVDDVEDFETINFAEHSCFGPGSRIIITSRNKGVFEGRVDNIYEVEALTEPGALQLFNLHAFKQSQPEATYAELSKSVVRYAKCLPLAVKILGSYLFHKSKEQWESAFKKLKNSLNQDVGKIFRISYDALDPEEQQVFLHIACFFKGESQFQIERVLDACNISTLIDLTVLENKSLINISGDKVLMHDLLQQMGHEIVRNESKEPGKRSRLHNPEDVIHVLTKNTGTEYVEGMFFDQSKTSTLSLDRRVFCNMIGMKMLKLYDSTLYIMYRNYFKNCRDDQFPLCLNFPQGLEFLSSELRYLHWHFYPLKALPSSFHFEKLVELNMAGSCVERLWTGVQSLPNLKEICMDGCRFLVEMPDLSGAPNLEIISFRYCKRLLWVSLSIQCLNKLHALELCFCENIMTLPSFENISSLKALNVHGCLKINKFPEVPTTIQTLLLGGTAIEEIPSSIGLLSQLQCLDLYGCLKLRNLSRVFSQLQHVHQLLMFGPYVNSTVLVNGLCCLTSIRVLSLLKNGFKSLPSSIKQLSGLIFLDLSFSERLQSLPELPVNLEQLEASHCTSLQTISNSMLEISSGRRRFNFAGCVSLDHNNLLIHVLPKMLQLASKTVESHQGRKMIYSIIFPGDNIPKWIEHQNTGFSIILSLTPNWYENFMGFVLSAVLLIGKNKKSGTEYFYGRCIKAECQFQSIGGESYFMTYQRFFVENSVASQSKNLLLLYDSDLCLKVRNQGKIMDHYNEVSIKFFVEDKFHNPLPSRIQKCGVRLLYEGHDYFMQESNHEIGFQEVRVPDKPEVESIVVTNRKRIL